MKLYIEIKWTFQNFQTNPVWFPNNLLLGFSSIPWCYQLYWTLDALNLNMAKICASQQRQGPKGPTHSETNNEKAPKLWRRWQAICCLFFLLGPNCAGYPVAGIFQGRILTILLKFIILFYLAHDSFQSEFLIHYFIGDWQLRLSGKVLPCPCYGQEG